MARKRICVLNPYLPTLGGGEKYMGYLLQFMEHYYKEVEIDIIVHNFNEIDIHSKDYVTIEDLNRKFGLNLKHTKIIKVDLNSSDSLITQALSKHKIEKITQKYDLFINHMYLSRHVGKARKNIYLCMFPPKTHKKENQKGFAVIRSRFLDHRFVDGYDWFISISEFTDDWLHLYWNRTIGKSSIIYPPIFHESEITDRYKDDKKENIILSVGRFFTSDHCKKQLDMVRLFVNNQNKLGTYEYHLVGSVSNYPQDIGYFNQVKELASKETNVIIHKDCPYEELMDLYSRAKIFWHATGYQIDEKKNPEKMEHFGITTVEAMSYGAVPVVIDKGGQKEIVENGVSGFLWDSEEQCIESTSKLITDDNLRKQFAEKTVERAKRFSIDEFYKKNMELLKQLCE